MTQRKPNPFLANVRTQQFCFVFFYRCDSSYRRHAIQNDSYRLKGTSDSNKKRKQQPNTTRDTPTVEKGVKNNWMPESVTATSAPLIVMHENVLLANVVPLLDEKFDNCEIVVVPATWFVKTSSCVDISLAPISFVPKIIRFDPAFEA